MPFLSIGSSMKLPSSSSLLQAALLEHRVFGHLYLFWLVGSQTFLLSRFLRAVLHFDPSPCENYVAKYIIDVLKILDRMSWTFWWIPYLLIKKILHNTLNSVISFSFSGTGSCTHEGVGKSSEQRLQWHHKKAGSGLFLWWNSLWRSK